MKKCLRYQMRLLVRSPGFWVAMAFGVLYAVGGHVPTQHSLGRHCPAYAVQCVFYSRIQFYHTVLYVSVPDFGLHFFFRQFSV